ncbi:hypothetical protein TWF102_000096 [Orbilia oligospora]|uniref:Uncharacterized protein n=1 Tax=Orbilia oligospora TaxID=2813651 RepID=A0A7C8NKW4_ORBOL|nr:hypothetical protein TWF102_000096 [Orbilia oligospora]
MHLQALRLILIRLGIVAQTSSIPLCRTHPYDENTRGISLKAQMKSPGKGYTITKIDSQNQFSIGGTESKIEMGVSNPQAQDIFLSNNEATTARKKTDTKSNRTREQKSENFNLRLHDSGSGFSTERVSTAHLTPQNGILRAVEKRKSKGSENSIPREKLRKSRYKREVNGASTRPSSTILTTAPSSKPVIVTVSTSSSVSVPAISASPTPLSTAERIAAEEEEGKSHCALVYAALDGLPETVKNQNEGFRFNAGARTGGLDAWITFTEDLRMFSNRPIQTNDIDFAPPLDEIGPPGHVRTSRIYHDYADLTEPEIDEFGFQNWFGPGDNDFGYFESQYRDRTKGGRYPKPYHGRKKGGS